MAGKKNIYINIIFPRKQDTFPLHQEYQVLKIIMLSIYWRASGGDIRGGCSSALPDCFF